MMGRKLCASQASTAISSNININTDQQSNTPALNRHNPIIKDPQRRSFSTHDYINKFTKIPSSTDDGETSKKLEFYKGRRSTGGGAAASLFKLITNDISLARKSFSCVARPACDFNKTPLGSTRYLLGSVSEPAKPVAELVKPVVEASVVKEDIKSSTMDKKTCDADQVVVLKVSLHCRGCEGKVRKHLSRMQGVTSFKIDFAAKKVTVTGNITPLEILDSISKVKNAQFWTPPNL